jgi:hypothetical protein
MLVLFHIECTIKPENLNPTYMFLFNGPDQRTQIFDATVISNLITVITGKRETTQHPGYFHLRQSRGPLLKGNQTKLDWQTVDEYKLDLCISGSSRTSSLFLCRCQICVFPGVRTQSLFLCRCQMICDTCDLPCPIHRSHSLFLRTENNDVLHFSEAED